MNHIAPRMQMYVCTACGKRSKSQYGIEDAIDLGWDESCMLNSILVYEDRHLDGSYRADGSYRTVPTAEDFT
jgi:hypothetical protein